MTGKYKIRAIHDVDLDNFLLNLGLLEALEKGELRCGICGCQLTKENLGCIYPESGEIRICCYKPVCLREVAIRRRTKVG